MLLVLLWQSIVVMKSYANIILPNSRRCSLLCNFNFLFALSFSPMLYLISSKDYLIDTFF